MRKTDVASNAETRKNDEITPQLRALNDLKVIKNNIALLNI